MADKEKRHRLWINPCISTGLNVRNCPVCGLPHFCPVNVLARRKPCSAIWLTRKPLSLLSKPALSTTRPAFTITTSFIYLFKLTKTAKASAPGRVRLARTKTVKQGLTAKPSACPLFFVYRKKVMRRHRREAGRRFTYGPACKTDHPSAGKPLKSSSIVEKPLHIHRIGCAEQRFSG